MEIPSFFRIFVLIMEKGSNLIKVFTGDEIPVNLLKEFLEEIGIGSMVSDEFQSGISSGFVGGVPSSIDLYIQESDFREAEPVINDFIQNNKA
jgi:hypothetical protein